MGQPMATPTPPGTSPADTPTLRQVRRGVEAAVAAGRLEDVVAQVPAVARHAPATWARVLAVAAHRQSEPWTERLLATLTGALAWSDDRRVQVLSRALVVAATRDHLEAAQRLVRLGADPLANEGEVFFQALACRRRNLVLEWLPHVDPAQVGERLIAWSAQAGDLEMFDAVRARRSVHDRMGDLVLAMEAAAEQGHAEFLRALLGRSPMVDITERMLERGILGAARANRVPIMAELWGHPAHVHAQLAEPSCWYLAKLLKEEPPPTDALRWMTTQISDWNALLLGVKLDMLGIAWAHIETLARFAPQDVQADWVRQYPHGLSQTAARVLAHQREGAASTVAPTGGSRRRPRA